MAAMLDPNKPLSEQLKGNDDEHLDYFELGATLAPYGPKQREILDQLEQAKELRGAKLSGGKQLRSSTGGDMFVADSPWGLAGGLASVYAGKQGASDSFKKLGEMVGGPGMGDKPSMYNDMMGMIGRLRDRRSGKRPPLTATPGFSSPNFESESDPAAMGMFPFGGT